MSRTPAAFLERQVASERTHLVEEARETLMRADSWADELEGASLLDDEITVKLLKQPTTHPRSSSSPPGLS